MPELGRFTQEDPAQQGTNLYIYCNNDPVNRIDPSGLWYKNAQGGWVAERGDTLWGLAANLTGNGNNWKKFGYNGRPENLQIGQVVNVSKLYGSGSGVTITPVSTKLDTRESEQFVTNPNGNKMLVDDYFKSIETAYYYISTDYANRAFKYEWTGKSVSLEFKKKVIQISFLLAVKPDDLMAVMAFESTLDHTKWNGPVAVGLIQFTTDAEAIVGKTRNQLAKMTAIQQLDYVAIYLSYWTNARGRLKNLGDLYMAVFCPAGIGKSDNFILYENGKSGYSGNSKLDRTNKGYITRGDALQMVLERRSLYLK